MVRYMKILAVSDVVEPRFYQEDPGARFDDVDLVLACGDLPPEYLTHLVDRFQVSLYYVCGNHDIRHGAKPPRGCFNLHGRLRRNSGFNFAGLEGSRWYNGGPYQYTEWQMRLMVFQMVPKIWWRGGADIFISHAPPRYVRDAEDPCHRGFKCFLWLIRKFQPAYFVHGHIHRNFDDPDERITDLGKTKVVNSYGYTCFQIDHQTIAG